MTRDLGLLQVVVTATEDSIPSPASTKEINLYILADSPTSPTTWTLKGRLSDGSKVAITAIT